MRLNGKQVVSTAISDTPEAQTIRVDTYKTSDVINKALKQSAPKNLKLERYGGAPDPVEINSTVYSRDLILLSKPRAAYTDAARMHNVQGAVKLRVTFLSNGTIGPINLAVSLDKELDRQAFEAARLIKFLPAEIDGKPVDVSRYFEYAFSIY